MVPSSTFSPPTKRSANDDHHANEGENNMGRLTDTFQERARRDMANAFRETIERAPGVPFVGHLSDVIVLALADALAARGIEIFLEGPSDG
jgi:hypothetical protein